MSSQTSGSSSSGHTPSAAPSATPSATPSVSEHQDGDVDPDVPLPSIERGTLSEVSTATESSHSSPIYTPSTTSHGSAQDQSSRHESLEQHLQDLRLGSTTPQAFGIGSTEFTFRREGSRALPRSPSVLANGVNDSEGHIHPVEKDSLPSGLSHVGNLASPPINTPASVHGPSLNRGSLEQHLQSMRLGSTTPQSAENRSRDLPLRRELSSASSTPSIQVTPTPTSSRNERTNSLADGLNALDMRTASSSGQTPTPNQLLEAQQLDARKSDRASSQSPSPSPRRRRSSARPERSEHNIENEEPPQSLFHAREIQNALANARQLTGMMVNALSRSNLHQEQCSNIHNLYQQAIRLRDFQLPSSRIVGLVGDSGVGKSSLINSLLDKKDFARASNSGAACTCVVTEYHYHDRDDFLIEVDYFTLEELRTQFQQLLRAYREHQSADGSGMTTEERDDLKRRADLAISTFNASFRENLHSTPGVLTALPFDHAIETLMDWTTQILGRPAGAGRGSASRESFENTGECSDRLQLLTSEFEERDRACLWPFIRKIKVYLRAHILSRGLIIADLPGLRDLNSARQNVTERYVRQCHQIFAVTEIGRAITDPGVKEVFELARRASLSNAGIVCTRSDDIQASEAKQDWREERARIEAMQSVIARSVREMETLREEIGEFGEDTSLLDLDDQAELLELQQRLYRTEVSHKQREYELQEHIINVRNRKVTQELRHLYRRDAGAQELNVLCISNTNYWKYRNKPAREALPFLNLSNIIALRRHCVGIVAESHLRATTEYIRDEIPAFLGSVELWVQAGSGNANAERKKQVLGTLSSVQDQLDELTSPDSEVNEISETLREEFKEQIASFMRERSQQWSISAGRASMMWNSWHHGSYSAFCRKYGSHYTNAVGRHRCWNEEAIELMNDDLSDIWTTFNEDIESHVDSLPQSVTDAFAAIFNATRVQDNGIRNELSELTANLRRRRELILHGIENANEDFQEQLSRLQTDALAPVRTAIIGQLMQGSYESANMEYGTGSDRRRKDVITGAFGSRNLFNSHRRRFKENFANIANELQEKVSEVVATQVSAIEVDLDTLRDENVVLESERNPQFRRDLGEEVNRVREEMNAIQRVIDGAVGAAREDTPMVDG
ncbi:hypothetical protein BDV96DRAFT_652220 [Lophiotrema nucula]|uniref:P-loop containing nucleoside triphosphate hydrolase protein n=1 Tax=Lophiotrema nucula TaxID=690887 RepID=A0A6A5YSC3_9PLEO|nr:hypothetical protein BDV96DRAFT_652220 [Lophiotrema nucula]